MDVSLNGDVYWICEMLVSNGKCCKCVSYRPTLRKMYSRWRKSIGVNRLRVQKQHVQRANFRYLTTPQARVTSAERKVDRLLKENRSIC